MARTILVAATTLVGGVTAKSGKYEVFEAAPGTELTDDVLGKLGIKKAELERLQDIGAIAEATVREAGDDAAADAALADQLAAAIKRAEEAEARLAELQSEVEEIKQQLEEATKPTAAATDSTPAA